MSCENSESRATVVAVYACYWNVQMKKLPFLNAVETLCFNDILWAGGGVDGAGGSGIASLVLMVAHRSV